MKTIPLVLAGLLALAVTASELPAQAAPTAAAPSIAGRAAGSGGDSAVLKRSAKVDDPSRGTIDRDTVALPEVAARGRAKSKGVSKVAALRVYWTAPDAITTADVTAAFAEVDAWYNQVSLGQLRVQTAVSPSWLAIPATDCNDLDLLANRAIAAQRAANPAFNPKNFDHIAVYFPHDSRCEYYSGLAELPGKRLLLNGIFDNGYSSLDIRTTTHEMGHNMGLSHSSSIACKLNGTPVTIGGTCAAPIEYGDYTDNMGNNPFFVGQKSVVPAFSASQQAKLGWLGKRFSAVSPCQDVTLSPFEGGSGTVAARFGGIRGATYWLEYRHPGAGTYDDGLPGTLRDGAVLHLVQPGDGRPRLLDGRPDAAGDMVDAAIPVGRSVPTPDGYSITTLSAGDTAVVRLTTARPSPPLSVRTAPIPGGAYVRWGASKCAGASPVSSYRIDFKQAGGKWRKAAAARGNRTDFRISLPGRSGYAVRVTAVNAQGPSLRPTLANKTVRPLAPRAGLRVKGGRVIKIGKATRQTVVVRNSQTGRAVRNATVLLQKRALGPWRNVKAVRTSRSGIASLTTAPRVNTRYRWVFPAGHGLSRTTSRPVRVAVAPLIGLTATKKVIKKGGTVSLVGGLVPKRPGQPVGLQVRGPKGWVTVKAVKAVKRGRTVKYRIGLRINRAGTYPLRVVTLPTRTNAAGISRVIVIRVR